VTGEFLYGAQVAAGTVEGFGDGEMAEAVGADSCADALAQCPDEAVDGGGGETGAFVGAVEVGEEGAGCGSPQGKPTFDGLACWCGEGEGFALRAAFAYDVQAVVLEVEVLKAEGSDFTGAKAEVVKQAQDGEVAAGGGVSGGVLFEEAQDGVVDGAAWASGVAVALGGEGGCFKRPVDEAEEASEADNGAECSEAAIDGGGGEVELLCHVRTIGQHELIGIPGAVGKEQGGGVLGGGGGGEAGEVLEVARIGAARGGLPSGKEGGDKTLCAWAPIFLRVALGAVGEGSGERMAGEEHGRGTSCGGGTRRKIEERW